MKEKDIEQIKFDLGLCADVLMALFISLFINKIVGIIYFCLSITVETIMFAKKNIKDIKNKNFVFDEMHKDENAFKETSKLLFPNEDKKRGTK